MNKNIKKIAWIFMLLCIQMPSFSQKDVTQFLGIPIDGSKAEMIQKLKAKGYTNNTNKKDVLEGEFNGIDVNIHIVTNNNKVWRIMVADANSMDETNTKIRFNNLIKQFQNNKNYRSMPDSTIVKYTILDNEDISYGLLVEKKRYEAVFYQKTVEKDSATTAKEIDILMSKYNSTDKEKKVEILTSYFKEELEKNFKKTVWFMINEERYGKYYITIFYDNRYNKADGEGL